ncbi:hypothetical protein ZIOFF_054200 [Zingiber officinale]|uniref:Protein FLUORESCENT IN BLUE LIGHT, chloroplastic n=1 Tax=Zingiber officinale TaxID=94328 RepID=A0A8J5FE68_ZINOF|nr:hypothetical protein ZIOFF_054200 [Zingiber officinale]
MAAPVRCFPHPLTSSSHRETSWRSSLSPAEFSGWRCLKNSFYKKIFSMSASASASASSYSLEKEIFNFKLNVRVSNQAWQTLSSFHSTYSNGYIAHKEKSERIDVKLSKLHFIFKKVLCCDQVGIMLRLPKTLILTNIWMFTLPLEVLAETCEPDKTYMKMPLLFAIAVIGATVSGLLARTRKDELKRLNSQLRQINEALRRQAKIEAYAPGLSYAPVGRIKETEIIVDPEKQQLLTILRTGKNFLRNQDPKKAFILFKEAFDLAQSLEDHAEEKKAARGLGASLQRQGKYMEAIKYYSKVIEISKLTGENSDITEAYGAIADCYTELGDLERAAKFYDKYIARLETN